MLVPEISQNMFKDFKILRKDIYENIKEKETALYLSEIFENFKDNFIDLRELNVTKYTGYSFGLDCYYVLPVYYDRKELHQDTLLILK